MLLKTVFLPVRHLWNSLKMGYSLSALKVVSN